MSDREWLAGQLAEAGGRAIGAPLGADDFRVEVPHEPLHGDYSSNIALRLARRSGLAARELAGKIIREMGSDPRIKRAWISGPGFISIEIAKKCPKIG